MRSGVADVSGERRSGKVMGDRLRRIELTVSFRDPGAARRARPALGRTPRSGRPEQSGFVIEQRLVHRAELLDAEIAVGNAFSPAAIGRRPRRQRETRRLAASSSRSRRSARGVLAGANNRPLNGVTRNRRRGSRACASRRSLEARPTEPVASRGRSRDGVTPRRCSSRGRSDATAGPVRGLPQTAGKASGTQW